MFVGASPGGTGGSIKTTTLRVLTSCTKAILQGKEEVLLYERKVPVSLILKAVGVLVDFSCNGYAINHFNCPN